VHFSQRGILLADANAALWMVAGSLFSVSQLRRMNTTGAIGQFSNRVTQAIRSGSRNMIHVSGPGAHFTHAGCSAVYTSIRQWLRMRKKRIWSLEQWQSAYTHRATSTSGMVALLLAGFKQLGISWDSATVMSYNGRTLSIGLPSRGDGAADYSTRAFTKILHDTRSFLRYTLTAGEAFRLPGRWAELEDGMMEDDTVLRSFYAMRYHKVGPSVVSGAVWTQWKAQLCGYSDTDICPRCNLESESERHRLWRCPDNVVYDNWFRALLDGYVFDYADHPRCLVTSGIPPRDCTVPKHVIVALQHYILMVNSYALDNRPPPSGQGAPYSQTQS
jgi:hypothetical protein